jgi:hypothetical protein
MADTVPKSSDLPGLEQLQTLVADQRRKVAGTLRIVAEDKSLRVQMQQLLERAGVDAVTVDGYEVRRWSDRDGIARAKVTKLAG